MNENEFIADLLKTIESGLDFVEGCIRFDTRKVVIIEVFDQMKYLALKVGNKEISQECYKFVFLEKYEDLETIEGRYNAVKDLRGKYETLLDEFTKGGN